MVADFFDLTYEEISGSNELLKNFILGEWEKDFVIVQPGDKVKFEQFYGQGGKQ